MDWDEESTEVLTISNRVRQVICKNHPDDYSKLMDPEDTSVHLLSVKVGKFELHLGWRGTACIFTRETTIGNSEVFRCAPPHVRLQPEYSWNKRVVREEVIPALDAEMVLDDLSLL